MDKYGLDSHKLHYHVSRVHDWLSGAVVYPVYIELSPCGMCNHRCRFCALDFMGYKNRLLATEMLAARLGEMAGLGVKSVMFGGEGEPLLHPDIGFLADHAKKEGLDVAFTTNGVYLEGDRMERVIESSQWVKVSCNGGTPATYAAVHRTRPEDFGRVLENLEKAAVHRQRFGGGCVLGLQMLLLPENEAEVLELARLARNAGVDYLVIKPYSQHPQSRTEHYRDLRYEAGKELEERCRQYNDERFHVVVRTETIASWNAQAKKYDRCLGLPFWAYVDSAGRVWGCSMHLGDERFCYGDLGESSFRDIWEGEKRQQSMHWFEDKFDAGACRINCRMDKINQYLWRLKHPPEHVNFI